MVKSPNKLGLRNLALVPSPFRTSSQGGGVALLTTHVLIIWYAPSFHYTISVLEKTHVLF